MNGPNGWLVLERFVYEKLHRVAVDDCLINGRYGDERLKVRDWVRSHDDLSVWWHILYLVVKFRIKKKEVGGSGGRYEAERIKCFYVDQHDHKTSPINNTKQ